MNQRYPQDPARGRQPGRSGQQYAGTMQGRGERFGRQFDDDSPRYAGPESGDQYEDRDYGFTSSYDYEGYGRQPQGMNTGRNDPYLGSYASELGPQYYQGGNQPQPRDMQGARVAPQYPPRFPGNYGPGYQGSAYGNEDFRQGSGQRQWQQAGARLGQRQFVGQGSRGSSNPDLGYGYGDYRQSRFQGGYVPSGYARDFDEGDFDQAFGGYSPSQYGYGDSWSGYGAGGYGSMSGQGFDEDYMGTTHSTVQSGAYGQGPGGYSSYGQGAGRGGYGMGSGYTGGGQSSPMRSGQRQESQFGKGPKGYVRSDERLKEDISEKLTRDYAIDASDISVEAKNGAVTLTGSVDNRQLKHYVEDLVENCSGVRDIDNRLTVRARDSRAQPGSGSLGGSTGPSSATGTSGSKTSTTGNAEDGGSKSSRN